MRRPRAPFHLVIVSVCTLAAAWFEFSRAPWLERLEFTAQDALVRAGRTAPVDSRLVFLAIDTSSASLQTSNDLDYLDLHDADDASRRALALMAHEWPWSREIHGLVLDRLVQAGACAVIFDFTFPKPSPHDDAFRAALETHRARVVVAANVAEDNALEVETVVPRFGAPSTSLIPDGAPRDPRVGYDNFWSDGDGIVRQAQYRWARQYGVWQSEEELSLAARALEHADEAAKIPRDRGSYRLRFAGPAKTFLPHPIYEIFVPAYWRGNYAGGEFFRDKIVVVGASGNWQQDHHLTPFGVMPGPELHLNAINAALHSAFVSDPSPLARLFLILGAAAGAAALRRRVTRPYFRFAGQLAFTAGWIAVALALFNGADLLLPCVAPLFVFNLNGISGVFVDVMNERREKAQIRRTLERYVSRNVVEEMIDQPDQFARALGGELRDVTILFSDIRGFTQKSHDMNSRELVTQLNEYFSAMVECVFRYGGTLDKFIGDAVMAVWGNAHSAGAATDARHAVSAARAMLEELAKLNERWAAEGRPQFRIGIGLNSGPVVVGNIGSPQRMEFTVIGDAVNVAWRLQEKTKGEHLLLLGEAMLPLLGDDFPTEIVGEIYPRGDEPVAYARLVELEPVAV